MRILHVISNLEGGGAQRQLGYLTTESVSAGHDVHVAYAYSGDPASAARLCKSGAVLHELARPQASRFLQRFANHSPALFFRLDTIISRIAPDVVQTWLLQAHIIAGSVCLAKKMPWVLREPSSAKAYPRNWKSLLMNILGRRASAIVSNSAAGDGYWSSRSTLGNRFVIRNGVPSLEQEGHAGPFRDFGLSDARQRLVLYAGRFTQEKNVMRTIEAFVRVSAGERGVSFVLCGDGPLLAEARSRVAASPASSRIWLPGFRTDISVLMRRAEVFVSVSHFEGTPNTVLEAMSIGCPVVVSDIPEHREILDESCACLVDRTSVPEIVEGLRAVLADPAAARARATAARHRVSDWSVQAMALQYESVYRTVLAARGSACEAPVRESYHS